MPAYNKFNCFSEDLVEGLHDFDAHVFKLILTNTLPVATNTVLANISQIASGNGYTTDGATVTVTTNRATGTTSVQGNAVTWTGGPSTMATFQYYVLYNSSTAGGPLIAWWNHGSAIALGNGDTFKVSFNNTDTAGKIFDLV